MNEADNKTIHLVQPGERVIVDVYDAEMEIAVREPETSLIRHMYNAWRLAKGIATSPTARLFNAFNLAINPDDLRYVSRAGVGWPYSIEKRAFGFRTHESLATEQLRYSRLAVVLSECESSEMAAYEGITEVAGGDEVSYRRLCLPVLGNDAKVSGIYVILRPLFGDCLSVPWTEPSDAARS